ncbi:hypothetical protein [Stomatohabitans albus]|uniref:hypothetical protein n=1 Tax=Stomatohabitans albus TaxID=3110766 RepID=UPI00300C9C17
MNALIAQVPNALIAQAPIELPRTSGVVFIHTVGLVIIILGSLLAVGLCWRAWVLLGRYIALGKEQLRQLESAPSPTT